MSLPKEGLCYLNCLTSTHRPSQRQRTDTHVRYLTVCLSNSGFDRTRTINQRIREMKARDNPIRNIFRKIHSVPIQSVSPVRQSLRAGLCLSHSHAKKRFQLISASKALPLPAIFLIMFASLFPLKRIIFIQFSMIFTAIHTLVRGRCTATVSTSLRCPTICAAFQRSTPA